MKIEKTEVKISLTVREAQALWAWLEESNNNDFRFRGHAKMSDGAKDDCQEIRNNLMNLLSEGV